MKKNVVDMLDILDPARIVIKEYANETTPFKNDSWIDNSDLTIQEVARLLPHQLSFVYAMLHEFPYLLPSLKQNPGRVQELIFQDIMQRLKNKSVRDCNLERKITQIWIENGGQKPIRSRGGE
jgi:hypothetical protein